MIHRRDFLKTAGQISVLAGALPSVLPLMTETKKPLFDISLAQWSLHKRLFSQQKPFLDNLDFAKVASALGIHAIEYVNSFFKDKARDVGYLTEMRTRAAGEGVKSVLIMVDGEGALGAPDANARTEAVEKHHRWVEAANFLGCHSIRVNAQSSGSYDEQMKLAADGLHRLADYGARYGINVIVENHGGLSSNGEWLAGVMKMADHKGVGTLPDFGNFSLGGGKQYDRYKGVGELMPYAKAVSAKSHDFNEAGDEIHTDYFKMLKIVVDAGYRGYVGVEYEGDKMAETSGILATKHLLERVRLKLSEEK